MSPIIVFVLVMVRFAIGALLLVSTVSKVIYFDWFSKILGRYRLVPTSMISGLATLIVAAEGTIGVLLITAWDSEAPLWAASLLLSAFTLAVVANLLRGRADLECGCSGFWKRSRIGWALVLRNAATVGLALCQTGIGFRPAVFTAAVGLLLLSAAVTSFDVEPQASVVASR